MKSVSPMPSSFRRSRVMFTVRVFSSTKLSVSHSLRMRVSREHALLLEMEGALRAAVSASDARAREAGDYYTMWVHQIKTPIAAMRLMLQEDGTQRGRELEAAPGPPVRPPPPVP